MKKLFSALAMMVLLLSCSVSFAEVGVRLNGSPMGTATDINFVCGSATNSTITTDGSIYNINCSQYLAATGMANGGAVSMTTADTAVSISYTYTRKNIAALAAGASFQLGSLANGYAGQLLTIFITEVGSSGTWTLTPTTKTGFISIKFTAANDMAVLLYVNDTVGWVIISYDGSITITKSST